MMYNKAYCVKRIADRIRCCFMRFRLRATSHEQRLPASGLVEGSTNSGMTLMEVVVAMSILALIMVLLWGTTSQGLNSKERVEKRDQVLNQARVAYHKILDDLSMSFLASAPADDGGEKKTLLTYFIAENKGEGDSLRFTSFSNIRYFANAKESDQAQIEYKLLRSEEEDETGMNLFRSSIPWLDNDSTIESRPYVVAKNVKGFNLEYYDERKGEWGEEWDTEKVDWRGRLPKAVRIKIEFNNPNDENDAPIVFTSAIILPLSGSVVEF